MLRRACGHGVLVLLVPSVICTGTVLLPTFILTPQLEALFERRIPVIWKCPHTPECSQNSSVRFLVFQDSHRSNTLSNTRRVKVNQVATDVLASRSDVTIRDMRHMDPQLRLVLPPVHLERISILPERNTYIQDFEPDLIVIAKRL